MPLKVFKRGQVWHYRGKVGGQRLRGSTRTKEKEIAEQIAAQIEARAWKCHLHGPESVLTFAQAALLYRQAGKNPPYLDVIEDYWKDTPVRQINSGAVRQAAVILHPDGTGATRNRWVIVPTQAVINHTAELELCQRLHVKRFPVEHKEREPVTLEWIEDFMAHADPHLGALACFMFLTGARISEALNVLWKDIDLQAGTVLIRQTKVRAERRAYLPSMLVVAIANIESNRYPDAKVFEYSTRSRAKVEWDRVVEHAGIKRLSFHCCRHGFATALLRSGVDPVTVAELGGWADVSLVLKTYGHAMKDPTLVNKIIPDTPETQKVNNPLVRKA